MLNTHLEDNNFIVNSLPVECHFVFISLPKKWAFVKSYELFIQAEFYEFQGSLNSFITQAFPLAIISMGRLRPNNLFTSQHDNHIKFIFAWPFVKHNNTIFFNFVLFNVNLIWTPGLTEFRKKLNRIDFYTPDFIPIFKRIFICSTLNSPHLRHSSMQFKLFLQFYNFLAPARTE